MAALDGKVAGQFDGVFGGCFEEESEELEGEEFVHYLLVYQVGDHGRQCAALDFLLAAVGFLKCVEGPVDY